MGDKKRRIEFLSFYNFTAIEKHLSKMAQKGWLIESISSLYWTYRKIEPMKLHFSIKYCPAASEYDPKPAESQQALVASCAQAGWTIACSWFQMQIFYTELENPVPIETDPVAEVNTIHAACKKNYLRGQFLFLILGIWRLFATAINLWRDPITTLSDSSGLCVSFALLCLLVLSATELTAYFCWYHKAKKAAADGILSATPNTAKFQAVLTTIELLGLFFWILQLLLSGDKISSFIAIITVPCVVGLLFFIFALKKWLKKANVSKTLNFIIAFVVTIILLIIMMVLLVVITLAVTEAGYLETDMAEPPLSLSELVVAEDCETEQRIDQSLLLSDHIVNQSEESLDYALWYRIVTVKVPFLYDHCKNYMYNNLTDTYIQQDATPWGAKQVYCMYDADGDSMEAYLLCYEDKIIEIYFNWPLTDEQTEIVAKTFSP